MIQFVLLLLGSYFPESQQSPQNINNFNSFKDSFIINNLVQSNLSSLSTFLSKWRNTGDCPNIAYVSDGSCDDGKLT